MSETATCPRCVGIPLAGAPLARCGSCTGAWLSELELRKRIDEMQQSPSARAYPIFKPDSRPAITCPTCSTAMETVLLFDVAVDRCSEHGIWFDTDELAVALRRSIAAPADDDRSSHPIITFVMRLFESFTP